MKKRYIALALFLWCGRWASAQTPVSDDNPGSLWPGSSYNNPLLDHTARREGDIITIVVSESSIASFTAATSTSKKDANSTALTSIPLFSGILNGLGTSANGSTDGKGTTSQTGNFQARITCTVKKVLPNGNMVIEGQRWIKINKDYQSFKITGIVRRLDVRVDNTVLSENVADAEIVADGKGQISDRQRRGFLTRLLEWLF